MTNHNMKMDIVIIVGRKKRIVQNINVGSNKKGVRNGFNKFRINDRNKHRTNRTWQTHFALARTR
jgi:hypothetical protein